MTKAAPRAAFYGLAVASGTKNGPEGPFCMGRFHRSEDETPKKKPRATAMAMVATPGMKKGG